MDFTADLASRPLAAIPICFLAGVLTSFTPCVYPMIPITAALVGGQTAGARDSDDVAPRDPKALRRAVLLTSLYVLGLALVYSALGLFAGLSGTLFGSISSNPWLYLVMANVLVLAALSLLDVIPLRLPVWLMQRAATAGTAGRASGAFVMGAMSGLVAAPCSAPVMAAVLTWVSTTQSAALGFIYLFAFSLGMCALLVAVGLSAGTVGRLPRAGAWMLIVKKVFAFVMIGVAEYYLIKAGQGFL
jgi:thiol:disulfide interchange protein DsbD